MDIGINSKADSFLYVDDAKILKQHLKLDRISVKDVLELYEPPTLSRTAKKPAEELRKQNLEQQISDHIRDQDWPGLLIRNTEDKGDGVVTKRQFEAGVVVCNYPGKLVYPEETKVLWNKSGRSEIKSEYLYFFHTTYKGKSERHCYDANEEVLSETTMNRPKGRLINHSPCHANLTSKTVHVKSVPQILFYSNRVSHSNEELSFKYGDNRTGLPAWMHKK